MSNYTSDITAYIAVNYPDPPYSALDQASLLALGEAVAALVVGPQFADERIVAIETTIDADPIFNQMPKQTQAYANLLVFCEFCLNLAIAANTVPGGGSRNYSANLIQSGTGAPIPHGEICTFLDTHPVWARSSAGVYTLTSTKADFSVPNNIRVFIGGFNISFCAMWRWQVVSAFQLRFTTSNCSADILTGVITPAAADDLLNENSIMIQVNQ